MGPKVSTVLDIALRTQQLQLNQTYWHANNCPEEKTRTAVALTRPLLQTIIKQSIVEYR